MPVIQLEPGLPRLSAVSRAVWRSVQVAVAVAVIVVPFGYAITGVHNYVLLGAGCGFAIGVGVSLRLGGRNGISTGILVGSFAGMAAPLLAAFIPGLDGPFIFAPPLVALTVGLVDGLGTSRLRGYREASLEALTVCALAGAGLLPALGPPAVSAFIIFPAIALVAGYFNCDSEGRRHSRPPAALMLGALAALALTVVASMLEFRQQALPLVEAAVWASGISITGMALVPVGVFLSARAFAVWLQPRLQMYVQLVEYLRVMWVPLGGFAAGYLAIILVFSGFCGMLERFVPGSFAGAADAGFGDWLSFSFFSAIAQDYSGITPVSAAARTLVGVRLLLSVGWALVVFSAMMTAIQPQLERIARRDTERLRD